MTAHLFAATIGLPDATSLRALLRAAASWTVRSGIEACVVAALVFLAQYLLRRRVSARWRYNLWLLVVARLLLPGLPATRLSPFNLLPNLRSGTASAHSGEPAPIARATVPWTTVSGAAVRIGSGLSFQTAENLSASSIPERAGPANRDAADRSDTPAPTEPDVVPDTTVRAVAPPPPSSIAPDNPRLSATPIASSQRWRPDWLDALAGVWLLGAILMIGRLLISSLRLDRGLRRLPRIEDPAIRALVEEGCAAMKLRRAPALLRADGSSGPAVVGLLRPRVLLPDSVLERLERDELQLILLHELAHIRRGDLIVNCALGLLQSIHWFNPLLWLAFHRVRADRESACDELALSAAGPEQRSAYGPTILKLLELFSTPRAALLPVGTVGILTVSQLNRRLTMIARFDGQTSRSRWSLPGMALTALLGAVALTGAVSAQDHPGGAAAAPPATVSQPGPGQNTTLRLEDAAAIAAAQAQIKAAEAELQVQKADLNRFMQLSRSNAVSVGDVEKAKASVVRAEAQVEVAKANLAAEEAKAGAAVQAASPPAEGGAAAVAPGNAAPDGGIEDADARDADARARESLHKAIAVKFDGVGLGDALDFLRDKTGVDLVIDAHSLESIGVDRNAPVTLTLERPVPGDQALRWILRMASPECAFTVDHGVVFVSARDQVSHMTVTRAYTVDDLVGEANGRTPAELVELIQQFVAHETWRDTGGETGAIRSFANKILVTQTEPNHREIEKLLDLLRKDERGGKTGVAIPTAPPIDPSPTRSLPGAP